MRRDDDFRRVSDIRLGIPLSAARQRELRLHRTWYRLLPRELADRCRLSIKRGVLHIETTSDVATLLESHRDELHRELVGGATSGDSTADLKLEALRIHVVEA